MCNNDRSVRCCCRGKNAINEFNIQESREFIIIYYSKPLHTMDSMTCLLVRLQLIFVVFLFRKGPNVKWTFFQNVISLFKILYDSFHYSQTTCFSRNSRILNFYMSRFHEICLLKYHLLLLLSQVVCHTNLYKTSLSLNLKNGEDAMPI